MQTGKEQLEEAQVKDFQMDVKGAMQAYKEGATRKKKKWYDKAQQSSTTGDKWINEHADNYYMWVSLSWQKVLKECATAVPAWLAVVFSYLLTLERAQRTKEGQT